jgi:hypothetical protein
VDLVGQSPTASEIAATCEGRTPDAIVRALQAREAYLWRSAATWRDRLDSLDITSGWRDQKALYAEVFALHRSERRYDAFARAVITHPGFTSLDIQAVDRVRRTFRAFLGRAATEAEAVDLAGLVQPFLQQQLPDPDFPYLDTFEGGVFPVLCQPLFRCEAKLFGGGRLDLSTWPQELIPWSALTAAQRETLGEFGRLVTRQPIFWEAEADEILSRLLGWSDGGRFPREPGIVLPELRQALAAVLAETGDVPGAERLVLTSQLYVQAAETPSDGLGDAPDAVVPPPWTAGPVKAMRGEDWLASLSNLSVPFGACDPRYPDVFPFFMLVQAVQNGEISRETYATDLLRLREATELRMPLYDDPSTGLTIPDLRFMSVARLIGGCPGVNNQRVNPDSMSFAFSQEAVAELLCNPSIAFRGRPMFDVSVGGVLDHQMRLLYGRGATPDERAAVEGARAGCAGADCAADRDVSAICVALAAGAEGLFY